MENAAQMTCDEKLVAISTGEDVSSLSQNTTVAGEISSSTAAGESSTATKEDDGQSGRNRNDYSSVSKDSESDEDSDQSTWADDHLNREALIHIATCFLPGNHGKCTSITPFGSGTYHHVELLEFQDGWSCVGRFGYNKDQPLGMDESEVATMQFVAKHTTIPVPEIYFVNYNHDHVVGAAFMLMERKHGKNLWDMWPDLSVLHRQSVLSQIADVNVQLANLEFERIGSLTPNGVGPLFKRDFGTHNGPFDSLQDTLYGMIDASPSATCCDQCKSYCDSARVAVTKFFESSHPALVLCKAPFSLLHGDFAAGNVLFAQADPNEPPVLTGLLDFDGSSTTPVYYQYDHTGWLTTDDWREPEDFAMNKMLRKHFVRALAGHFPAGSQERRNVRKCFRLKSYFLDKFIQVFPGDFEDHEGRQNEMSAFLKLHENGKGIPGGNVLEWAPDSDSEIDDEEVCGSDA